MIAGVGSVRLRKYVGAIRQDFTISHRLLRLELDAQHGTLRSPGLIQDLGEVQRSDARNLQRLIAARNHVRRQCQRVVVAATETGECPHSVQPRCVGMHDDLTAIDDDVPESKVIDRDLRLGRASRLPAGDAGADLIDVDASEDVDVAKGDDGGRDRDAAIVSPANRRHGLIEANAVGVVMLDRRISLPAGRRERDGSSRGHVAADGDRLRVKLMMYGQSRKSDRVSTMKTIRDLMTLLQQLNAGVIAERRELAL